MDRGYPGSVTSKEWRTFSQKNGGPQPRTYSATLKNGALQLKNGAPEGHKNNDMSKEWRSGEIHFQWCFFISSLKFSLKNGERRCCKFMLFFNLFLGFPARHSLEFFSISWSTLKIFLLPFFWTDGSKCHSIRELWLALFHFRFVSKVLRGFKTDPFDYEHSVLQIISNPKLPQRLWTPNISEPIARKNLANVTGSHFLFLF